MKSRLIAILIMTCLFPLYLYGQEIHVRRGNAADFPAEYQGRREGDGLYFGMSDLPPGRIVNLTRPELVTAGQRRVTAQILIVKQIPSQGRLRSSEIVLSPLAADHFGVRSELFLVTNNNSVRWTDNLPPLPPPLPSWPQDNNQAQQQPQYRQPRQQEYYPPPQQQYQQPQQQVLQQQPPQQYYPQQQPPQQQEEASQQPPAMARFRKSTVEEYDYRMFGNGELEYALEPADVRPPEDTVTIDDVVDEIEQSDSKKKVTTRKPSTTTTLSKPAVKEESQTVDFVEQEPQKLEIDVNVGLVEPVPAPVPEPTPLEPSVYQEPYPDVDAAMRSRLRAKTMNSVQPGLYMQLGYYSQQKSLVRAFLAVEKWFDVKIVPTTQNGVRYYRLLVGAFRDDELGVVRENLRKLGLSEFFLVRY